MARKRPELPKLPPPSARECWWEFAKWALGIPLAVLAAGAVVAGGLWLSQGMELATRTMFQMMDVVLWLGAIALLYPLGLILWILDLRDGLRAARAWQAMTEAERAAALAAAPPSPPPRRARRKGG